MLMDETPLPSNQPQNTLTAVCLLVIATIMLGVALSYTRAVMIPFVFALFLSYFLEPWVGVLKTHARLPHWVAVVASLLAFFGLLAGFVLVLRSSIVSLINSFSLYEARLAVLGQAGAELLSRFGVFIDEAYIVARIKELPIFSYVQSAAGSAMSLLSSFVLVMVFLIFLISGKGVGEKRTGLGGEIDDKIRNYILTKVLSNLFTAVIIWFCYLAFGLDLALMFAILCFLLCFIPTLGSLIATVLPLPIALIQYSDSLHIVGVIAVPAVIQILLGNFLEPKLLGRGLDLHPVTILLSLMFWGLIWGISGMFLAVPITAVLKIVLDKHPLTHNFSELLAGRSPI